MLKIKFVNFTQCSSCNMVSKQENGDEENLFLLFECPMERVSMSTFIERKLNSFEERHSWRDEDGCGRTTIGRHSIRIKNII